MRTALLAAAAVWAATSHAATIDANVETYRVFGPEHPGPYKHPASITELDDGSLYIAYYGGSGEYEDDTAVYGSRLEPGATQWTPPAVIADTPGRGEGNPVVWQAPDGRVWLFYVNRYGDTWCTARVKAKISQDGARTWSDSFMLTFEPGTMARGKPLALMDGDFLLPMYHETGGDRERLDPTTSSFFLRYHPPANAWTETNRIASPTGNLQPQPVQFTEDHLVCYLRRGGGYDPDETGYIQKSESHDGGRTWSDAVNTEFPNPNAAVDAVVLDNGHLLLTYNDSMNDRTPLSVAISTDQGKTFKYKRDIAGGDNSFAYPYVIQTQDGKIRLLYTTNERTTIMLAVFEEAAILSRPWRK